MEINVWENQYKKYGFKAQRLYPNEELLRFMGGTFFSYKKSERKKLRILEVGCGSGANLWMIAKEGFNAFGMDISHEGLSLCSKMLKHWGVEAKLKLGNIASLPYEDNYFDAVIDIVSLQHLTFKSHKKAISEIKRVLKTNGWLFSYHLGNKSYSFRHGGGVLIDQYTINNISNPKAPLANNGITCFPTENAMQTILNEHNFKNISVENVIKSYNNRTIKIYYLAIRAQK